MEQQTIDQIDIDAVAVETIQDVSCLVTMTQHKWGAKVTDNAATRDLKAAKNASGDAGKFRKNLLNGSKAGMSKVTTAMSKAYRAHVTMTLPWGTNNARLISNSMLLEYMKEMNVHQQALAEAKTEWLQTLPKEIETAIQLNGDMGNAAEYPTPDQIVKCFSFEFDFSPVPDSRGFSGLPDGFRERFADIYETRAKGCAVFAQQDGVERLLGAVASFADVLRKDKPRIYESTIDQLRVLHGVATSFNITENAALTASLDRMQADFLCYTKDQLTANADNQRKALDAADSILKSLNLAVQSPDVATATTEEPERSEGPSNGEPAQAGELSSPAGEGTAQSSEALGAEDDNVSVDDPELAAALLSGD